MTTPPPEPSHTLPDNPSPNASFEMSTDAQAQFISEHGRLFRPITNSAFDPFRRQDITPPLYYKLLHYLCIPFLILLRLTVALVVLLISYTLVKLFGPPVTRDTLKHFKPTLLPPWRRRIVHIATQILARGLLFAFGFWTISGHDHLDFDSEKANKATIISNHSSVADPCLLAYLFAPAFVAKSAVNKLPFVGRVGAAQHAFYIDRMGNDGISVTEHIMNRQRLVTEAAMSIPPVAIFPEGTTTNSKFLLPFKSGAFVAGVPIAPVLIRFRYSFFPPTFETIHGDVYLWKMLTALRNRLEYYRMPVYYPNEEEKKDPKLFAENVRVKMLEQYKEVFGEELISSKSNYADKMEYLAIKRGKPLRKGLKLNMEC